MQLLFLIINHNTLTISLLTWPIFIYSILNVGGYISLPGSEARVSSGTVPSGLRATLYIHPVRSPPKPLQFFYHIILSPSSAPTLLYLSLRLRLFPPCLLPPLRGFLSLPDPHDIQGELLPPSPGWAHSWLPIRRQTQFRDSTVRNALRGRVLATGSIYPNLSQSHHFQLRPNGWVHPCPVPLALEVHACYPPRRPVVKSLKGFIQPGVQ